MTLIVFIKMQNKQSKRVCFEPQGNTCILFSHEGYQELSKEYSLYFNLFDLTQRAVRKCVG